MDLVGLTSLEYYSLAEEMENSGQKLEEKNNDGISLKKNAPKMPEIMAFIKHKNFTRIQSLTLLLKHSLEGQFRMENDNRGITSISEDLIQRSGEDEQVQYLYPGLIRGLPDHFEGIIHIWKQNELPEESSEKLSALLYFIIINQWIKLPVKCLSGLDSTVILRKLPVYKKDLHNFVIREAIIEETAHKLVYANRIMQLYQTKFDMPLERKRLKSAILDHLLTRLRLAEDPSIDNEEDLNSAMFKFLIKTRDNELAQQQKKQSLQIENERVSDNANDNVGIKSLYRAISKNCKEIMLKSNKMNQLSNFFFSAGLAYNFTTHNTNLMVLQKNILHQILVNTLIYRRRMGLDMYYPKEEFFIHEIKNSHNSIPLDKVKHYFNVLCTLEQAVNKIDFKQKQVFDQDMIEFHTAYIEKELEIIESRIFEVERKIKTMLEAKKAS